MRRLLFGLLLLYTALLPFERLWEIVANVDTVFKPYRIVGLTIIGLWLVASAFSGKHRSWDVGDKAYLALFSWGVAMALFWNVVYGNNLEYTTHILQLTVFAFVMYVFTKGAVLTTRHVELVFLAYLIGFLVSVGWAWTLPEIDGRFRGIQNNPNQLGTSASLCFLFFLSQFIYAEKASVSKQTVRMVAALVMIALVALSGSRGAAAGTAVGTATLLFLAFRRTRGVDDRRRRNSRGARAMMFAFLCAVILATSYQRIDAAWEENTASARFDKEFAVQTAGERWDLWRSGVSVGLDHFGVGAGMQQYMTHHKASMRRLDGPVNRKLAQNVLVTHSDYIGLFANYGLVGMAIFGFYMLQLVRQLRMRLRGGAKQGPEQQYLIPFSCAVLGSIMVVQITMECLSWCDYFMTIALVHNLAFERVGHFLGQTSISATNAQVQENFELQPARPVLSEQGRT